MRVLGIDPGIGRTGIAVLEGSAASCRLLDARCLATSPGDERGARYKSLHDGMAEYLARWSPDMVAIEKLFFAKNVTTAMTVSEARGVILLALAEHGAAVSEFSPPEIKMLATGNGDAPKSQVAAMIRRILRVDAIPGPDDVSDACAIALCGMRRASLHLASARAVRARAVPR